jgi:hypothetical protein
MADCECLGGCIFFNDRMDNMPAVAAVYKTQYCRGSSAGCARYRVFKALGRGAVPPTLFPNRLDLAEKLIAGASAESRESRGTDPTGSGA